MKYNRILRLGLILTLISFFLFIYFGTTWFSNKLEFSGKTMGTTYNIVCYNSDHSYLKIQSNIEEILNSINVVFSTYKKDSEISKFNQMKSNIPIIVSESLWEVLILSQQLYIWSNGLWDPTIKPLVDIWGFSSDSDVVVIPSNEDIESALSRIGFDQLVFGNNRNVTKLSNVTVDLSSIAKGYGVDKICDYFKSIGITSYMVEIGGEVRVGSRKPDGSKWRIGINDPNSTVSNMKAIKVLELENKSLATSGDYRQFYEIDGIRYSHILNPKTGFPIKGDIVSISVVGPNCVLVDGLATAMLISGMTFTQLNYKEWSDCSIYMISSDNKLIWSSND